MRQNERDFMLLAILEPEDRAKLLSLVEEIIAEEVPTRDTDRLNAAAEAFELCGETKPDDVKIVAMQIAAALRLHLLRMSTMGRGCVKTRSTVSS